MLPPGSQIGPITPSRAMQGSGRKGRVALAIAVGRPVPARDLRHQEPMFEKLTPTTAWVVLIVAGLLETVWAVGMKYTEGFTKPVPTAIVLVVAWASFYLLVIAMRPLPAGTAYAVWTGIGAVGTVVLGIVLFNEPATFARLACVAMIVGGIIGLKLLHD